MSAIHAKLVVLVLVAFVAVSCMQPVRIPTDQRTTVTPLSQTKPVTIHIRVRIYGGGNPLQNVQVELYRDRFEPVSGELVQMATTNKQGIVSFDIEAGTYGFWVRVLDMSSPWRYGGSTQFTFSRDEEIQIRMLPAH